jgi:hypothetical protein
MGLFKRKRPEPGRPGPEVDPCFYDPAARRLRAALEQRDWPSARDFLTTVTDPDDRAFYVEICADVSGLQDWIEEWIAAERDSTLPLLVRGAHAVHWAWEARGAARAESTSTEQFQGFRKRLKLAEDCLDEVVERDPGDTTAWTFLIRSARGRQVDRTELERRWDGVVGGHPHHWEAHTQKLQYLCAKWSGSDEEMFTFAQEAAAKSPAGSPLGGLVAAAHIEKWLSLDSGENAEYITRREVRDELLAAAEHSVLHPDHRERPAWLSVPNSFAYAFALAGEPQAALRQFEVIGDRVTRLPWSYYRRDPGAAFVRLRQHAQDGCP